MEQDYAGESMIEETEGPRLEGEAELGTELQSTGKSRGSTVTATTSASG